MERQNRRGTKRAMENAFEMVRAAEVGSLVAEKLLGSTAVVKRLGSMSLSSMDVRILLVLVPASAKAISPACHSELLSLASTVKAAPALALPASVGSMVLFVL